MLGFFKFWFKISLYVIGAIILVGGAIHGGQTFSNLTTTKPPPAPIPTSKPLPLPIYIPEVEGVKTTKTQPVIDIDPIITCNISTNCGGGSRQMTKSECDQTICCQIGDSWSFYMSKDKCYQDQKANYEQFVKDFYQNDPDEVSCSSIGYSEKAQAWTYILTQDECAKAMEEAKSRQTVNTSTPYPTKDPAIIEQQRQADIQHCKDNAKSKYDGEASVLRNQYRAAGALSSSAYGQAAKNLQDDYNYWIYLCENAY